MSFKSAAAVTAIMTLLIAPASAAGCLKGVMVGGVAGHFAGRHPIMGAMVGCAVGHHLAAKQQREEELRRQQHGTSPHGGQGNY